MEAEKIKTTEEIIREIAWLAWKGAANAYRMYPENKHTFDYYWDASKNQFAGFASQFKQKEQPPVSVVPSEDLTKVIHPYIEDSDEPHSCCMGQRFSYCFVPTKEIKMP